MQLADDFKDSIAACMHMKIQIVDDNAEMRTSLRNLLVGECDECSECSNGAEAVALFQSNSPDLVLMDIRMPVMNGFEALIRIRSLNQAAKIAMVTQYDDDAYRRRAEQLGADAFLLKDRPEEIKHFVEQLTRGTRAR